MTTLRKILDVADNEIRLGDKDAHGKALNAVESWAYGQERECPKCHGTNEWADPEGGTPYPCSYCIGGTIREPGLVERASRSEEARAIMRKHGFKFETRLDQSEGFEKLAFTFYTLLCEAESALRVELGVEQ